MRDFQIWTDALVDEVATIADSAKLRRLWSGENPKQISSFTEEVAHIFNDFDIDSYLASKEAKALLSLQEFEALLSFRNIFSLYVDQFSSEQLRNLRSEEVLGDKRWREVGDAARAFITLFRRTI